MCPLQLEHSVGSLSAEARATSRYRSVVVSRIGVRDEQVSRAAPRYSAQLLLDNPQQSNDGVTVAQAEPGNHCAL